MHSDAELVVQARAGDPQAFAAIYDRYADRIHDFGCSVLRDRDEAADAMQDTFVLAARRIGQLHDPAKLRPWLFAIARHEAIRRGRARGRLAPMEHVGEDLPSDDTGPEVAVTREDAEEIVWASAAGLSDRDRVLLDLHVRHELDGHELAEAIGVTPAHAYTLTNRLRDQVERSLGALLVARLGREDCTELQAVLEGWDGRFTPLWRKRVARHVDGCDVCAEHRRILASPLALLAAAPLVPAPLYLRSMTLDRIEGIGHVTGVVDLTNGEVSATPVPAGADDGSPQGWRRPRARGGFPPPLVHHRWMRAVSAAAAAALLAVVVGAATFFLFDDDGTTPAVFATDTTATTTPSSGPVPPDSTQPPTSTAARAADRSEENVPGGVPGPVAGGNDPPIITTTTTVPRIDTTPPAVTPSARPGEIYRTGGTCTPTSTTVTATVQDASAISSVTLTYSGGGQSGSASMTPSGGNSYSAPVGGFPADIGSEPASVNVTVTAVDEHGNTGTESTSFTLSPCVPQSDLQQ